MAYSVPSQCASIGGLCVTKRNGDKEPVSFDKILARVRCLGAGLCVDPAQVALKTIRSLAPDMQTSQLDDIASDVAASQAWAHPHYGILAGRIALSNVVKDTAKGFSVAMETARGVIDANFANFVKENAAWLDSLVDTKAHVDYDLSYQAMTTLKRSYLLRSDDNTRVLERPIYMLMRVAVALHYPDKDAIEESFNAFCSRECTHATPTLCNAGRKTQQLASCFLLPINEDSIQGIFKTLSDCAQISKWGGGIGIDFTGLRSHGTPIKGTGGTSNGLRYVLKTYNEAARYVDQGGGKRKGAWCAYLEIWHRCVRDFLDLRLPQGADSARARELFYALWIPDLFMERVEADGEWTLFCPSVDPELHLLYGDTFRRRYESLESSGVSNHRLPAREIWRRILTSQRETGMPFMLYKDTVNAKSNHSHLGTIRCSNLCTEIMQYSSPEETAVCNLASISLPHFVKDGEDVCTVEDARQRFDFTRLAYVTKLLVRNLNATIDRTDYPVKEGKTSNKNHRPIGIGVQGLADVFLKMHLPFAHTVSKRLNAEIFEQIYYSALDESCTLAEQYGVYDSYPGSHTANRKLQMDLWTAEPQHKGNRLDWTPLRARIAEHGVRNSLLCAPMPTATTAQILGNSEMTEPHGAYICLKKTLSGEFMECNPHLIARLEKLELWTPDIREKLIEGKGSVQGIEELPRSVRDVYRTVWEIPQRDLIDMAADRGRYIDQSQSLNLHCDDESKMSSMHFHVWKSGLKGSYYRRSRVATHPLVARLERPDCAACSA